MPDFLLERKCLNKTQSESGSAVLNPEVSNTGRKANCSRCVSRTPIIRASFNMPLYNTVYFRLRISWKQDVDLRLLPPLANPVLSAFPRGQFPTRTDQLSNCIFRVNTSKWTQRGRSPKSLHLCWHNVSSLHVYTALIRSTCRCVTKSTLWSCRGTPVGGGVMVVRHRRRTSRGKEMSSISRVRTSEGRIVCKWTQLRRTRSTFFSPSGILCSFCSLSISLSKCS